MQNKKVILPLDIYYDHLQVINGIEFTPREIEIISCLLNGRMNAIPRFLSISSRAVEAHTRNIRQKASGLHSHEDIVNFVKKSEKFSLIKNEYYLSLEIRIHFEKILKTSFKKIGTEPLDCFIIYGQQATKIPSFIPSLKEHLKCAGFKIEKSISEEKANKNKIQNAVGSSPSFITYLLCIFPEELKLSELENKFNEKFILQEEKTNIEEYKKDFNYINLQKNLNYYSSFFEILKKLLPNFNFDKIISDFEDEYKKKEGFTESKLLESKIPKVALTESKSENWFAYASRRYLIAAFFVAGFIGCGYLALQWYQNLRIPSIQSDLIIPTESVRLDRPELIAQIDENFKGKGGIQIVALIGMGGAGKTILARQYAHLQKAAIIWEVNAKTLQSLKTSFENLARSLAVTEEDKKFLDVLQEFKKSDQREKQLIQFIKDRLKASENWILIYDNVDKMADIKSYFPIDVKTWGQGKIILTTQDSTIKNNSLLNHTIQVGELSDKQKLALFTKILREGKPFYSIELEKTKKFLKEIPSFPLDVNLAAYYLKATSISPENYLGRLNHHHKDFESVQQDLLKGAGEYTKTRYDIITLTIKQLIGTQRDFADLLLFISLLDSQNIPRELLDKYKGNIIVDNFIYNLKKYSLITNESLSSSLGSCLFIHKSTQEICLHYLLKVLNSKKNEHLISSIANSLQDYMTTIVDEEDIPRMMNLVTHCEFFLSHHNLLSSEIKELITGELICIYFYLGNYKKTLLELEKIVENLNRYKGKNHIRVAYLFAHLGRVYRELGDYKKAKQLLEQSLIGYEKYLPENYDGKAKVLMCLGNVYMSLGNYKEAQNILEQSSIIYKDHFSDKHISIAQVLTYLGYTHRVLGNFEKAKSLIEESIKIHKKHFSEDHIGFAWILVHLGSLYRELGDYDKAQNLIKQGLQIYKKHLSEDHTFVAWASAHLGSILKELGDYDKAKNLLMRSLKIYRKHLTENHNFIAWASILLGKVYGQQNNFQEAKNLLKNSLRIYENNYGKDHIETARILRNMGCVYLLEGNLETGEAYLRNALEIFKRNNHYESYVVLENLADLYLKKSGQEVNKKDSQQRKTCENQARGCLKQALEIVETYFPANSPHIKRINNTIKSISN
ncbi:MAG: hypothetical protein BGO67_10640 [Alphaproteobacteria bacterium 41-28]|nr:MAG: hypothetical protein BGO67_10640 [Alphaproteobacteria bacterium 41-28]